METTACRTASRVPQQGTLIYTDQLMSMPWKWAPSNGKPAPLRAEQAQSEAEGMRAARMTQHHVCIIQNILARSERDRVDEGICPVVEPRSCP